MTLSSRSIELALRSINEKVESDLDLGRGTSSFCFYFSLLDWLTRGKLIKYFFVLFNKSIYNYIDF